MKTELDKLNDRALETFNNLKEKRFNINRNKLISNKTKELENKREEEIINQQKHPAQDIIVNRIEKSNLPMTDFLKSLNLNQNLEAAVAFIIGSIKSENKVTTLEMALECLESEIEDLGK